MLPITFKDFTFMKQLGHYIQNPERNNIKSNLFDHTLKETLLHMLGPDEIALSARSDRQCSLAIFTKVDNPKKYCLRCRRPWVQHKFGTVYAALKK